jgi:hypothetical protein
MSLPQDHQQPGPGVPLTAEREQSRRLMQGMTTGLEARLGRVTVGTGDPRPNVLRLAWTAWSYHR